MRARVRVSIRAEYGVVRELADSYEGYKNVFSTLLEDGTSVHGESSKKVRLKISSHLEMSR